MKLFAIIVLAFASISGARGAVASSANYEITTFAFDAGGGTSSSANYSSEISIGLIAGRTFSQFFYANYLGFPAQLNTPPQAFADVRSHNHDVGVDIPVSVLIANDFDLDRFDAVTLFSYDGVSEAGGSIVLISGLLRYTPPPAFRGTDRFNYTIIDSSGDISTAEVAVASVPPLQQAINSLAIVKLEDGSLFVRYRGVINRPLYVVQSKSNLNDAQWQDYKYVNSSPDGIIEFVVDPVGDQHHFFRVAYF